MPEDPTGGEKTEEATPKKLQTAREEGQVGKSMEMPSVFVVLTGVILLNFLGYYLYQNLIAILRDSFTFKSIPHFTPQYCIVLMFRYAAQYAKILLPIMGGVFLAGLLSNLFQVGFHVSIKAIQPKFEKLDPIKGMSNVISKRAFVELIKNIAKIFIISMVTYYAIIGEMDNMLRLYNNDLPNILIFILKIAYKIFIRVILVLLILAILDLLYQKWRFAQEQMMTRQEVKEEHKQTEGDPLIKSKIRQAQFDATKRRMLQDVPEADVVVTNPIHLALAIKYDPENMAAPRILAKGAGQIAEKIKEIARNHNIPIIENKELAQNLYKLVDIGEDIPAELYMAVAELLAYVYKLKGKTL